ncbi:CIR protein [Plasmodium chabaudi adami]|uniref:CIR protein n=1 Tax=Plasmodium chabaudi adami TaxID=5826 RepID=A0A1D3L994_PLACE|nr:CIR protein [Plasmodium chabaudi adami]
MHHEVCKAFRKADYAFKDKKPDLDVINSKNGPYVQDCPYDKKSKSRKCKNDLEGMYVLCLHLFNDLFKISPETLKRENDDNQYVEYIMMWLGYRLFNIESYSSSTLIDFYNNYLMKLPKFNSYKPLIEKKKHLKDSHIVYMRRFYLLFQEVCYISLKYSKNNLNVAKMKRDFTLFHDKYKSLFGYINTCDSYLSLLNNLKAAFEQYKKSLTMSVSSNKDRTDILTSFKELRPRKIVNEGSVLGFDCKECKQVHIKGEEKNPKLGLKALQHEKSEPITSSFSESIPQPPPLQPEQPSKQTQPSKKTQHSKPSPAKSVVKKIKVRKPAPKKPAPRKPAPAKPTPTIPTPTIPTPTIPTPAKLTASKPTSQNPAEPQKEQQEQHPPQPKSTKSESAQSLSEKSGSASPGKSSPVDPTQVQLPTSPPPVQSPPASPSSVQSPPAQPLPAKPEPEKSRPAPPALSSNPSKTSSSTTHETSNPPEKNTTPGESKKPEKNKEQSAPTTTQPLGKPGYSQSPSTKKTPSQPQQASKPPTSTTTTPTSTTTTPTSTTSSTTTPTSTTSSTTTPTSATSSTTTPTSTTSSTTTPTSTTPTSTTPTSTTPTSTTPTSTTPTHSTPKTIESAFGQTSPKTEPVHPPPEKPKPIEPVSMQPLPAKLQSEKSPPAQLQHPSKTLLATTPGTITTPTSTTTSTTMSPAISTPPGQNDTSKQSSRVQRSSASEDLTNVPTTGSGDTGDQSSSQHITQENSEDTSKKDAPAPMNQLNRSLLNPQLQSGNEKTQSQALGSNDQGNRSKNTPSMPNSGSDIPPGTQNGAGNPQGNSDTVNETNPSSDIINQPQSQNTKQGGIDGGLGSSGEKSTNNAPKEADNVDNSPPEPKPPSQEKGSGDQRNGESTAPSVQNSGNDAPSGTKNGPRDTNNNAGTGKSGEGKLNGVPVNHETDGNKKIDQHQGTDNKQGSSSSESIDTNGGTGDKGANKEGSGGRSGASGIGSNSSGDGVDKSKQPQNFSPSHIPLSLPSPITPSLPLSQSLSSQTPPVTSPATQAPLPPKQSNFIQVPQGVIQQGAPNTDQQSDSNDEGGIHTQVVNKVTLPISGINPSNTEDGSKNGTDVKINEKSSIWCIGSNKKCSIIGIGIIGISIFIILAIMYKYLSFGSGKNSKKKKITKKVINLVDGKKREKAFINSIDREKKAKIIVNSDSKNKSIKTEINPQDEKRTTHITINSGYTKKYTKSVINPGDGKKNPLLNIYKLMQANPMPFINLFFLLIFFVYRRKGSTI